MTCTSEPASGSASGSANLNLIHWLKMDLSSTKGRPENCLSLTALHIKVSVIAVGDKCLRSKLRTQGLLPSCIRSSAAQNEQKKYSSRHSRPRGCQGSGKIQILHSPKFRLVLTPLAAATPLKASLQHAPPCQHTRCPAVTPQCSTRVLNAPSSSPYPPPAMLCLPADLASIISL